MKPSPISKWLDQDGKSIHISEFFLEKKSYPYLYQDDEQYAQQRVEQGFHDVEFPVEQLSPKGLSLLLYLFSLKEKAESQPVVVSTVGAFEKLVQLMNQSPPGTRLTMIVQFTDAENIKLRNAFFSTLHKTVCQFEKMSTFLRMLSLDGTNASSYGNICYRLAKRALSQEVVVYLIALRHTFMDRGHEYSRQVDQHSCGIFAIKDARQIHRTHFVSMRGEPKEFESTYPLTPIFLKNIQTRCFSSAVVEAYGDAVVNRKEETLAEIHRHHHGVGYASHFAKKYRQQVLEFLEKYKSNPAFIRECTEKFDGENLILEKLIERYGPEKGLHQTSMQVP